MADKPRFGFQAAMEIATVLETVLLPCCENIIIAGSVRRQNPDVGDIELVYIGKVETRPNPRDLFATMQVDLADEAIAMLEADGVLARRTNINGSEMYGLKNKLMRHVATGLPVDLFATTAESWWNYLVCRTGPADSNTRIASEALKRGYRWNPYGPGFTHVDTMEKFPMDSEEAVFGFVGLPYHPPEKRR